MDFPQDIKRHVLSFIRKYGDDYLDKTPEFGCLYDLIKYGIITKQALTDYNCILNKKQKKNINIESTQTIYVAYIRKNNNIKKWKNSELMKNKCDIIICHCQIIKKTTFADLISFPEPPDTIEKKYYKYILSKIIQITNLNQKQLFSTWFASRKIYLEPTIIKDKWDMELSNYTIQEFNIKKKKDLDKYIRSMELCFKQTFDKKIWKNITSHYLNLL